MQGRPYLTALLIAGRRPGIDPLAAHFGVADKALIEIGGEPMLSRVARVLADHPKIEKIVILAQEPDELLAAIPWMAAHAKIDRYVGGSSVSETVAGALAAWPYNFPFLLATADNPLLDDLTLNAFLAAAAPHDLAVGVVERRLLLASYPDSRRTWIRFRAGAWSGANLFWFGTPDVDSVLSLWQTIEQKRKRGAAVIRAFGLPMMIAAGLRLLSIQQAMRWAGRRYGLDAAAIALPYAEACIDVDTPADHTLVSTILAQRTKG